MTLRQSALAVQAHAYAVYSNFKVGAAVQAKSGTVYVGCNVENASYPLGTCAEAGAIAAMVAAGESEITAVYVVTDDPIPATPCGGCRQRLAEFGASDVVVTMGSSANENEKSMTLAELLPSAFLLQSAGGDDEC
ncbi:MAG: cytidine deaminase [Aestuariivita sp.]|nr:cytidine deaminase [Aestuariivita sp.]MCY4202496.1 cytidine deaminase [Aestuariivita sp.]